MQRSSVKQPAGRVNTPQSPFQGYHPKRSWSTRSMAICNLQCICCTSLPRTTTQKTRGPVFSMWSTFLTASQGSKWATTWRRQPCRPASAKDPHQQRSWKWEGKSSSTIRPKKKLTNDTTLRRQKSKVSISSISTSTPPKQRDKVQSVNALLFFRGDCHKQIHWSGNPRDSTAKLQLQQLLHHQIQTTWRCIQRRFILSILRRIVKLWKGRPCVFSHYIMILDIDIDIDIDNRYGQGHSCTHNSYWHVQHIFSHVCVYTFIIHVHICIYIYIYISVSVDACLRFNVPTYHILAQPSICTYHPVYVCADHLSHHACQRSSPQWHHLVSTKKSTKKSTNPLKSQLRGWRFLIGWRWLPKTWRWTFPFPFLTLNQFTCSRFRLCCCVLLLWTYAKTPTSTSPLISHAFFDIFGYL